MEYINSICEQVNNMCNHNKHFSNLTSLRPLIIYCFQNGRIGVDEKLDDTEGLTVDEVQEYIAEREAKANAQILEMVCHSHFYRNNYF